MTAAPAFVKLADDYGLPDAATVQAAVTRAYGAARFGFLSPAGMPAAFDPGAQQRRAQELLKALSSLRALLPPADEGDDLFSREDAREIDKAYGQLAGIVCRRVIINAPLPGAGGRVDASRFVAALAAEWLQLTGERPTAWRRGDDHTKSGGRFYAFVCDACDLYNIGHPSSDTVRRIISKTSPT